MNHSQHDGGSSDEQNNDDEHVEVDEDDIHAVANDLYLPFSTIVSSMLLEAQRQLAGVGDGGRPGSPTAAKASSNRAPCFDEGAALLESGGSLSRVQHGMTSVRVSLAHAGKDDDDEEDDDEDEGEQRLQLNPDVRSLVSSGPLVEGPLMASSRSVDARRSLQRGSGVSGSTPVKGTPKKRLVRFAAASEIERVHVYEVDNSLFISIEYSRPLFGWVLLLLAIVCGSCNDIMNMHVMATEPSDSIYTHVTWSSIGQAIVLSGVLLPAWFFLVKPTKVESRFLQTWRGIALTVATGVLGAFMKVSRVSSAHLIGQWRDMALFAVHAPLIVLFGKVFRNTVYREEVIGSGIFLLCFAVATLPSDVVSQRWEFGEVLSLSNGIYVASFLFLAVKARASRVSAPVVVSLVSVVQLVMMLIVCAIAGLPFSSHATSNDAASQLDSASSGSTATAEGVFAFVRDETRTAKWLAASLCSTVSLVCYVMTLRFIPPLTVSVSMCLQALASRFAAYLLLFNVATAPWFVCPETTTSPNHPFVMTTTAAPLSQEGALLCGAGGNENNVRNLLFSIGSCVAVVSGGYLVYVSSIKRSKVDRLLKQLNNRKVPKNPYQSRTAGVAVRSSPGVAPFPQGSQERRNTILKFRRDRAARPAVSPHTAPTQRREFREEEPDNTSLTTIAPESPAHSSVALRQPQVHHPRLDDYYDEVQ